MDIEYKDLNEELKDSKKCAHYQVTNNTEILIFITAWTDKAEKWLQHLQPIAESSQQNSSPFYLVACNRVGVEKSSQYVGGSCIVQLRPEVVDLADPASAQT